MFAEAELADLELGINLDLNQRVGFIRATANLEHDYIDSIGNAGEVQPAQGAIDVAPVVVVLSVQRSGCEVGKGDIAQIFDGRIAVCHTGIGIRLKQQNLVGNRVGGNGISGPALEIKQPVADDGVCFRFKPAL